MARGIRRVCVGLGLLMAATCCGVVSSAIQEPSRDELASVEILAISQETGLPVKSGWWQVRRGQVSAKTDDKGKQCNPYNSGDVVSSGVLAASPSRVAYGSNCFLRIDAAGYEPVIMELAGGNERIDVAMKKSVSLLVDLRAMHIDGAAVRVSCPSALILSRNGSTQSLPIADVEWFGISSSEGCWVVDSLPSGVALVVDVVVENAVLLRYDAIVMPQLVRTVLAPLPEDIVSLSGVVFGVDGKPARGVVVWAVPAPSGGDDCGSLGRLLRWSDYSERCLEATSDADGKFEFLRLQRQNWWIGLGLTRGEVSRYVHMAHSVTAGTGSPVKVVLIEGRELACVVEQSIDGAEVCTRVSLEGPVCEESIAIDGSAWLGPVPLGEYRVLAYPLYASYRCSSGCWKTVNVDQALGEISVPLCRCLVDAVRR